MRRWYSEYNDSRSALRHRGPLPVGVLLLCLILAGLFSTAAVAARAGASCLVSLEAQMACGDGACLGCVVESKVEREGEKMVRVCVDGPVFDAAIIDWEAHNTAYDL